jgi:hypothetical protein
MLSTRNQVRVKGVGALDVRNSGYPRVQHVGDRGSCASSGKYHTV